MTSIPSPLAAAGAAGTREPWHALVEDARWAPSPHNLQPWRVRPISEREAELCYLPERLIPRADPTGRFSVVGLGVFVESMAIAAAARGMAIDATLLGELPSAEREGPVPIARLQVAPGPTGLRAERELLVARRTSRIAYDGRRLSEASLARLAAIAADWGHWLEWSQDEELVRWVVALNAETLFLDMDDAGVRRELARWIRLGDRSERRARDGLSARCLGFPGPLLALLFRLHPVLGVPGVRLGLKRIYGRTMRGTRTVAWLSGPFDGLADWFATGRMLARLWLALSGEGLVLHPFGSVITNSAANARLRARIGDPASGTLWLAVRLGRSAEPPRSLRHETADLLLAS